MYIHIYNHTSTLVTYLHYRVDSLSVHEVVLYGVLRDHFGLFEDSLAEHKLGVATPHRLCVSLLAHGCVFRHLDGRPLVSTDE